MGIVFGEIETDIGSLGITYPRSDGKAVADLIICSALEQLDWVRDSGVWLFPIEQMAVYWQPARRAFRSFAALAGWLEKQTFTDLRREHLARDVRPVASALKKAVAKGATEVMVGNGSRFDVIERAKSGRSLCRICGKPIAAGSLRFGEDVPWLGPFAWHHLECGTRRGKPFLRALRRTAERVPGAAKLETSAMHAAEQARPRFEIAPTGQAKCFVCRSKIAKGGARLVSSEFQMEAHGLRRVFTDVGCAPQLLEGYEGKSAKDLVRALRKWTPAGVHVNWDEIERRAAHPTR
jgi:hypothetical protein